MSTNHESYRTHHASRRLRGFDYTGAAAYFVTVCTHERALLFGQVVDGRLRLSAAGRVVAEEWHRSETLRDELALDAFVVMPNHVHGIAVLAPAGTEARADPSGYDLGSIGSGTPTGSDMARHVATPSKGEFANPQAGSLGTVVGAFKAAVTRRINRQRSTPGAPVWQRNYHDRVLRDEREWRAARRYIAANPARWHEDRNHPTPL